jgi:hypothetical protein
MTCCRSLPGRAMNRVHCDDGLMGYFLSNSQKGQLTLHQ